ncbi:hypothetical protein LCGC14_0886270 [marine sediment metagenome]|uniref:Uncharacterized protein n=1 Tax=marine sediment metagenome TaxID=412755 RepID=A0A0F9S7I4_9ZZZZ|nr:hypothetical protein [bacterium]
MTLQNNGEISPNGKQHLLSESIDFLYIIKKREMCETSISDRIAKLNLALLMLAKEEFIQIQGLDDDNNIIYKFPPFSKRMFGKSLVSRKISKKGRKILFSWADFQSKNNNNTGTPLEKVIKNIVQIFPNLNESILLHEFNINKLYSEIMLWGENLEIKNSKRK